MSDENVVFNPGENNDFTMRGERGGQASVGFITQVVMKLAGIKDEKQANQTLLVLAIICLVIAGYILWSTYL